MTGRASLRQVAELAGVAVSSASRVLSGHPDVSEEMRDRVLASAQQLGYEHNLLWESLRRGVSSMVGILVRDISSRLWADIALGADMTLQEQGYAMLLANSRGTLERDAEQIRLLDQRRVDGLLVAPADPTDPRIIEALGRLRVPVVGIDRELPGDNGVGQVLIDHRAGVRAAVKELAELGHTNIGFVGPPVGLRPTTEATKALQSLQRRTGISVDILPGPFSVQHGYTSTMRLLTQTKVTALISGTGQAFPGVLRAIRELGLTVPDDVSLVAIDDIPLLGELEPSISVISRQPSIVGSQAASLLLDMVGGAPGETRTVRALYRRGESCGPPPRRAGAR